MVCSQCPFYREHSLLWQGYLDSGKTGDPAKDLGSASVITGPELVDFFSAALPHSSLLSWRASTFLEPTLKCQSTRRHVVLKAERVALAPGCPPVPLRPFSLAGEDSGPSTLPEGSRPTGGPTGSWMPVGITPVTATGWGPVGPEAPRPAGPARPPSFRIPPPHLITAAAADKLEEISPAGAISSPAEVSKHEAGVCLGHAGWGSESDQITFRRCPRPARGTSTVTPTALLQGTELGRRRWAYAF